jgi:hypothetical protein
METRLETDVRDAPAPDERAERRAIADMAATLVGIALIGASIAVAGFVLTAKPKAAAPVATVAAPVVSPGSAAIDQRPLLSLAAQDGRMLFGVLAREGGPIDVFAKAGAGTKPTAVRATLSGASLGSGVSCGPDCVRFDADVMNGNATTLTVVAEQPGGNTSATLELPGTVPASGHALLARANATMKDLRSLRMDETLSDGVSAPLSASYELLAPDRMRVDTSFGEKSVLIGDQRYDFLDGQWIASSIPNDPVPSYVWERAGQPRIVGKDTVDGTPVTILSVYAASPDYPTWYRLYVADDGRVLRDDMLGESHFMQQRFYDFDVPLEIEVPR